MSQFPKKFHGPELKCGGPSMCTDCKERIAQDNLLKYCWQCRGTKKMQGKPCSRCVKEEKDEGTTQGTD